MVYMYHLWTNILNNHTFEWRKSKLFNDVHLIPIHSSIDRLLGQGFSFDSNASTSPLKSKSSLPPNGRRIHVSSRIMSEILGTLLYLKYEINNLSHKQFILFSLLDRILRTTKQMIVCVY